MKIDKIFSFTTLLFLAVGCGNNANSDKSLFGIQINDAKKTYTPKQSFSASVTNKKNKEIDSIVYFLNSERKNSSIENISTSISLSEEKLGQRSLIAKIYVEGETFEAQKKVVIVSSTVPKLYNYKILETYPHDINAYTQGLEFAGDTLYESTGQYKESTLRKTNYKTGSVIQKSDLGSQYFGEGLTILRDKIYQLTWREKVGFIYNLNSLEKTGTFVYGQSKEGWGLCNNGEVIFKSDGSQKIWILDPNTLAEEDFIEIYTNKSKIDAVNELEWVDGKIYANIYQKDAIAIVNPANGAVEGVINMKGLKDKVKQHDELDVLNGIAYKGEKNILYITGKNWDKLFKIEVLEKGK